MTNHGPPGALSAEGKQQQPKLATTYAERKRQRDQNRARAYERKKKVYDEFVKRWNLACFKCETKTGPWAAARRDARTGRKWAICKSCAGTAPSE